MPQARVLASTAAAVLLTACASMTAKEPMSFFVSSTGSGKGADLGGLAGADALCQKLAAAAGAGNKTWRAYLSVPGVRATPANPQAVPTVNARDRIGTGPWYNAKGELIARDLTHLHDGNNLSKATALDERGNTIKGSGDASPIEHDILTGSRSDGTAFSPSTDTTCKAWTSSGEGSAVVGHHDRTGLVNEPWAKSWNFSHQSAGCSQDALVRTGGSGRLYCFAAD
ncbi:MAG: hypothetical protein KF720_12710 [Rubrivivax sp.]|nr:hypothetical protein [Rubrivivax sp.]